MCFVNATLLQLIDEFAAKYRGSKEERDDVLREYEAAEGDMDTVMDAVMCATEDDTPRFVGFIQAAIAAGEATPHDAFISAYGDGKGKKPTKRGAAAANRAAAARKSRAKEEAAEAEEYLREMQEDHRKRTGQALKGSKPEDSLTAMILANRQRREAGFSGLLASLEAKYGADTASKGKGGAGAAGAPKGRKRLVKGKAAAKESEESEQDSEETSEGDDANPDEVGKRKMAVGRKRPAAGGAGVPASTAGSKEGKRLRG